EGAVTLDSTKITDAAGTGLLIADREGNTLVNHGDIIGADGQLGVDVSNNDGETWFNELDATSENATAVFSRDSGRFSVLTGDINAVGGAAVDLEGTELNMNFNKVSASGGAYGIRIVDADGVFAITGATAFASGGVIQDAGTGVYLKNVDMFGVVGLDLDDNNVGLEADNVERLALTNIRVTDSTSHALDLLNVDQFHSINSQYLNSGSLDAAIVYEVSEAGTRVISMNSNTINATVGDGIRIEGLAGAAGSSLNFSFQGNAVKTHANFANAVSLDWNGILLANAITNGVQTLGSDSVGFDFTTTGTSLVQIGLGSNVIQLDGTQSTAVLMNTGGPAEIVIGGNQMTFNGIGSTGLDFTLAESADVSILSNTLVDVGGGGTGMLFRSLDGPSTIEIEQNALDFRGAGALVDRGIIFQTITDTVTLKGTKLNSILNATTPFFVPAGTTTGKININGTNLPQ
ncbi:MAG: hypothetical protein JNG89_17545, partial [Planctomycetaceae bacterium]|nr:hypothetical protein [Planctomycetaceae bacterium]